MPIAADKPLSRLRGRPGGGPLPRQRERQAKPGKGARHAERPSPNPSRRAGGEHDETPPTSILHRAPWYNLPRIRSGEEPGVVSPEAVQEFGLLPVAGRNRLAAATVRSPAAEWATGRGLRHEPDVIFFQNAREFRMMRHQAGVLRAQFGNRMVEHGICITSRKARPVHKAVDVRMLGTDGRREGTACSMIACIDHIGGRSDLRTSIVAKIEQGQRQPPETLRAVPRPSPQSRVTRSPWMDGPQNGPGSLFRRRR